VNKTDKRRRQFRFVADLAIEACRLQAGRIERHEAEARHDLDFYVLSAWRVRETACKVRDRLPEGDRIRAAIDDLDAVMPALKMMRDWLMHPSDPGEIGWVSWFSDSIMRLHGDGGAEYLISPEDHQPAVERLYDALCELLGDDTAIDVETLQVKF
jgi:hypothetical protein